MYQLTSLECVPDAWSEDVAIVFESGQGVCSGIRNRIRTATLNLDIIIYHGLDRDICVLGEKRATG